MILKIFITFFKIGLFTFGGGYAMIAQIKEWIVNKEGWLTDDELTEMIAIAEATPGPIAINMATYVGYKKRRTLICIKRSSDLSVLILLFMFLPNIEQPKNSCYLLLVCI